MPTPAIDNPRVLVLGRAKTGTTVISKAIQHSIPGARYFLEPKEIAFFDNPAWRKPRVRAVVKVIVEHWNTRPDERESFVRNQRGLTFSHRIAIVRDPRDEIISRLYFYMLPYVKRAGYDPAQVGRWLDLLRAKEADPPGVPVVELVRQLAEITGDPVQVVPPGIIEYFELLKGWGDAVYLLRYEDFMRGELAGLEAYLGRTLSGERSVGEFTWTRRSAAMDNWKQLFTPEDVAHFRAALEPVMRQHGYTDWELNTPAALDPSTGSAYVETLIAQARGG